MLTGFRPVADDELATVGAALAARWAHIAPVEPLNWVFQSRQAGPADTRLMAGAVPDPHVVTEDGARYRVHVLHGQNHGLFLDMAEGRRWVRTLASGQPGLKVLNLFAYTGAFSVAALLDAAGAVVNVDMSAGALAVAQQNHALNGLAGRASFLAHDIFKTWGKITPTGRAEGIFLTIAGNRACAPEVVSLTHWVLTTWISAHLDDFRDQPALCIAAEAYIRRAQIPLPERATDEALIRDILSAPRWGLVPYLAGVSALGAALRHELPGGWEHDAIWIQGRGHANPGLQFWQPAWCGSQIVEPNWTADNIYVHLEIELTESPPWRLKVHFETEPYYTQRELGQLKGHAGFATMRDTFRDALHAQHSQFPLWKQTWHKLQSAILAAPVGPDATVAQLRAYFAPAMAAIAPCITHALTQARAAMNLSGPPAQLA